MTLISASGVATNFLYGSTSESTFMESRLEGLDKTQLPLNLDHFLGKQ